MSTRDWWIREGAPGLLLWAALDELESGAASVLDSTGLVRRFPDSLEARMHLLDHGYVAYDGLDEDDARAMGFSLEQVLPPSAEDERELVLAMTQTLGGRA